MSEIKDEHLRAGLSQDEIDVLNADSAATAAAAAAGGAPAAAAPAGGEGAGAGDGAAAASAAAAPAAGGEAAAPAGSGDGGNAGGGEGGGEGAGGGEQAAANASKPLNHFAPTLAATGLTDEEAARLGTIKTEKAALLKKFYDGEMSAEDYSAAEDALATERADLLSKQNNATFAATYNQQVQQNLMEHTRDAYMKAAQSLDGVDYTKPEIAAKFERAFQILAADPEFKDKPLSELNSVYDEAHRMVKAQIGWTPPAGKQAASAPGAAAAAGAATPVVTKPAAAAAPAAPQPREVPKTLAGLPAAAQAATGDADMDSLANLDGDELMSKLASMPKATVERIMRKTS